jgi:hypothetical protein
MTEKAEYILERIRRRSKRRGTPGKLDRALDRFNQSTLDEVGPVAGGDQEIKVLKELNELQDFENQNLSRGSV